MNEPAGIGDVLWAIGLSGFLFLLSLCFLVAFVAKWRFVTPEWKQITGLLVFSLTLLFAWLTPWLYVRSILRATATGIPVWVPATAVATEGIVALLGRCFAARGRLSTPLADDEERRKDGDDRMGGGAE